MQIINFKRGNFAGFLIHDSQIYIRLGESAPALPVKNESEFPIVPTDSGVWQFTASEDIIVNPTDYVRDNNSYIYTKITGPRPRNIVRR